MGQKLANNAEGTLDSSISTSDTTINLVAGHGARFPSLSTGDYFYATLSDSSNNLEIVKVTARTGDTLTVVRAQDGTTAKAYSSGSTIELRTTRVLLQSLAQEASVSTSLSGTNSYTGTLSPAPQGYETNQIYWFRFTNTNTSTNTTVDLNGFGVVNLRRRNGEQFGIGEIPTGVAIPFSYTGSEFRCLLTTFAYLLDGSRKITGSLNETVLTTGGTATAYTLTPESPLAEYTAGVSYYVKFHVACGANPTLQISGLASPLNLVKRLENGSLVNLNVEDIPANWRSRVTLVSATQALVEHTAFGSFESITVTTSVTAASVEADAVDADDLIGGNVVINGSMRQEPLLTAGTNQAYTLSPNPPLAAYASGVTYYVRFHVACGDDPTLQISGLSLPPNLVKRETDGTLSNLAADDIPADWRSRVTLVSATQAIVESMPVEEGGGGGGDYYHLSGSSKITGSLNEAILATGGTSTAYTLSPTSALSAYAAGHSYFVQFHTTCGANPTLQISSLANPPNLVKRYHDGTFGNLAAGDVPAGWRSRVTLISATQALVEEIQSHEPFALPSSHPTVPDWKTNPNSQIDNWTQFSKALNLLISNTRKYCLLSCFRTVVSGFPGVNAFKGGVLLMDGRVFCVPFSSTTAHIYDPTANAVVIPSGTYPGSGAFVGGVLLRDGRVFCIPHNSTSARIYDPVTNTLTTPSGTYPGGQAFRGGVLLADGRVFCVPMNSTTARIYNPATDTLTTPSGTYPGSYAFIGGVLLPDGRVFCVPHSSTTARIYDPITDTLITPSGTYPGSGAFVGGVLLPDGRVFCVPHSSTTARIYDPITDTLITPSGTYPGNFAFGGGVLLPDGRVFCVPQGSTTARIYDPVNDTLITPPGTYSGGASVGGVLLPDGRVFCVPFDATSASIVSGTSFTHVPFGIATSPFFNKF